MNSSERIFRYVWIDWIKALCIFLMVIGHTFCAPQVVDQIIYSFHMPAFFIVSGFLYKRRSFVNSFLSFFLPVVFFSLFNLLYVYFSDGRLSECVFFEFQWGKGINLFVGLWFIQVLMVSRFIVGDAIPFVLKEKYAIIIGIVCILLTMTLPAITNIGKSWYIYRFFPSFPFFIVGFWAKKHEYLLKKANPLFLGISIIIVLISVLYNGKCDIFGLIFGKSYLLFFANAVASFYILTMLFQPCRESLLIRNISNGTMAILGLHLPMISILKSIFPSTLNGLFFILGPIVVYFILYPVIMFCLKSCPFVLGKSLTICIKN